MSEPRWITLAQAMRIHSEQLAIFGGPSGLRDEGSLGSALDRPRNKFYHGELGLSALAAAYAFGLARNHLFVDGNKRAAFAVMMVFLRKNGVVFVPDQGEATRVFFELAAGAVSEADLVGWIGANLPSG
jgi:death on curing protein